MPGFGPAAEVLLFQQKDPKPFFPVRGPTGPWSTAPNNMARELASLKQPSPKSRFGAAAQPRPQTVVEVAADGSEEMVQRPREPDVNALRLKLAKLTEK